MKYFQRLKNVSLSCFIVILINSCGQGTKSPEAEKHSHEHESGGPHAHEFSCPMHPDQEGHEGEKCPKCGMAFVGKGASGKPGNFEMALTTVPAQIESGKKVMLSLTPKNKDNPAAAVPLDAVHEKKIHLIIVSNDLSKFIHIHPEYQASGNYTIEETFPVGGEYIAYADYKPTGSSPQLEKINFSVLGKSAETKIFKETILTSSHGDFTLKLHSEGSKLLTGRSNPISGKLIEKGKAIDANSVDNYLGAKAHMIIIGVEEKNYVHVHPTVENGNFEFHATFDKPGLYRAWVQFMVKGRVYTTNFVIEVFQGEKSDLKTEHGHNHEKNSGHTH